MNQTQTQRAASSAALAQDYAQQRSIETLLNCYCREVAQPEGQLDIGLPFGQQDWPQSIQWGLGRHGGKVLQVRLPNTGARLLTVVEAASSTSNYRYLSPVHIKPPAMPWEPGSWEGLTRLLLRELFQQTGAAPDEELFEQIADSVAVTAALLPHASAAPLPAEPARAFIESEQSLAFGHPFHPAPKSRQGVSHQDMLRYSPESGASFPLHYFAVRREFLLQQSLLSDPCDRLVARQAPAGLAPDRDFALIPVHPWQAGHLLELPAVAGALRTGRLLDLGQQGDHYYPTSSIRTLYQPDNPFFYKGSLNIRITNCVRKNAIYELEGALQVTRIMSALQPGLQARFPALRVLDEPAFMSVGPGLGDANQDKAVTEGFGLILRRNFDPHEATPVLAGALFGNHLHGQQRMHGLLRELAGRQVLPVAEVAEQWFRAYVTALMHPVLYCYFAHGVIFEPHLQNVVIGLSGQLPASVFLRDFEGVKLDRSRHGPEQLQEVSARAREALWYDAELGWNRVAYCLFVNHFCEAIEVIGAGDERLRRRLWSVIGEELLSYQASHGDAASARRIGDLLSGSPLPGKTNLLNRFFKRADRQTMYVPVGNPIGAGTEDA